MLYHAIFDISDSSLGLGTLTIADGTHTSIVITFADLRAFDGNGDESALFMNHSFNEWDIQSQDGNAQERLLTLGRAPLGIALTAHMQSQATANSWADPTFLGAGLNATTGLFAIGYILGGVNISLTFSTAAGRRLLGFASNVSGATGYIGTQIPYYVIKPTLPAVSNPTPDREASTVASFAMSDSGEVGTGLSREGVPIEREWTQQFEPVEKCEPINAVSTHPFTHRHLFLHCRQGYEFCVTGGGFGNPIPELFSLRTDGTAFEAAYASPNNTARRNVSYRTYVRAGLIEN
jgi:hypothetical protein